MTLQVEVGLGLYERIFIDIEHMAFEMSNPFCIILSIPCLCSIDDGKHR